MRTFATSSQDVGTGTVRTRDRDDRAPCVVLTALAQLDALEVLVEPAQHVIRVARVVAARRDEQVVRLRLPSNEPLEAFELPLRKNLRERWMHRHLARVVGLRLLHLARL